MHDFDEKNWKNITRPNYKNYKNRALFRVSILLSKGIDSCVFAKTSVIYVAAIGKYLHNEKPIAQAIPIYFQQIGGEAQKDELYKRVYDYSAGEIVGLKMLTLFTRQDIEKGMVKNDTKYTANADNRADHLLETQDKEDITSLANGGDKIAQYAMGKAYEFGLAGVAVDHKKAKKYYRKAAAEISNKTYVYSPTVGKSPAQVMPVNVGASTPGLAEAVAALERLEGKKKGEKSD